MPSNKMEDSLFKGVYLLWRGSFLFWNDFRRGGYLFGSRIN